jgi:N-acetylmuramoyl-L-alanine amidase
MSKREDKMINLVIAFSQQRNNKCVLGDSEQDHMYLIAKALYDIISPDQRFNAYLIPKLNLGSDDANLKESVRLSNEFITKNGGKGYHLELHSDAGGYATGASGLYYSEAGKKFITPIMAELMALTPWEEDVGIKKRLDLYALHATKAVAGLIEVSFHDQPAEAQWIHDNIKNIAVTIMTGIYKGMGFEPPTDGIYWKQKYQDLKAAIEGLLDDY